MYGMFQLKDGAYILYIFSSLQTCDREHEMFNLSIVVLVEFMLLMS
jgi:hypothetical protein